MMDEDELGSEVDARGLRCPLPIIRLAAAARLAVPGSVVTVLSTDPAAEPDIAAWCRMRNAELVGQEWTADDTGDFLRSRVRVG
jgi:tRNA 2-thiouridine synthesizing protein A